MCSFQQKLMINYNQLDAAQMIFVNMNKISQYLKFDGWQLLQEMTTMRCWPEWLVLGHTRAQVCRADARQLAALPRNGPTNE